MAIATLAGGAIALMATIALLFQTYFEHTLGLRANALEQGHLRAGGCRRDEEIRAQVRPACDRARSFALALSKRCRTSAAQVPAPFMRVPNFAS